MDFFDRARHFEAPFCRFAGSTGLQVWPSSDQKPILLDTAYCLDHQILGTLGDLGRDLEAVFRQYLQSGRVSGFGLAGAGCLC